MGPCNCLQWIGKITYYVGWIALLCGGLAHFSSANNWFMAMRLSQRNLFEVAIACFVICIASGLQSCKQTCKSKETSSAGNKPA